MLKHSLIHPEISRVLARAGHGSLVLIADGNYPAATTLGTHAELVSLNLSPGIVTCTDVLRAVVSAINIEAACVMSPDTPLSQPDPPIWQEFAAILGERAGLRQLGRVPRSQFYSAASTPAHALTVQTGDLRLYANLLLTVGVRTADEHS